MASSTQYTMLITSLPYLPPLFTEKQTPISRYQLDRRLTMLEEEDAHTLDLIANLSHWDRLPMEKTDESIIRQTEETLPTFEKPIREILVRRLEIRTLVAALRRRHAGIPQPLPGQKWGFGSWVNHILRNWKEPGFRLERVFPWVLEANQLLIAEDSDAFERLLLGLVWDNLGRAGEGHYFDFIGVVIYVLRWDIIARWTSYNGTAATKRFDDMVEEALGKYIKLFD